MAKLIFKEYDDDYYLTQNGAQQLRVINDNVRKYSLSAEHKPYAPVGALNFMECETVYYSAYPKLPHDIWDVYYYIHDTKFEIKFNIMRIVVDILNGKDVIIFKGWWDDWSVELFRDFLYKKYGLMMHTWSGDESLIPEAEFNPASRQQFAEELEVFNSIIARKEIEEGVKPDHMYLGMFYPYHWSVR